MRWNLLVIVPLLLLAAAAALPFPEPSAPETPAPAAEPSRSQLRYEREYPSVGYGTTQPVNPVALLSQAIARGEAALDGPVDQAFVQSLLDLLEIDASSQVLVFSKTSVRIAGITPETPRAIYFNDDVYLAWIPGEDTIEIATMDPRLGPVFYTLESGGGEPPEILREYEACLRCHDSYSLTGGGVPRFMMGSGYTGARGELVSHEAWILTDDRTPLRSRWGGWYVTGTHGNQTHLGNLIVRDPAELGEVDLTRTGNVTDLGTLIDTGPYLGNHSDIVALLVAEHQITVQNQITRANFDARTALAAGEAASSETRDRIAQIAEPLVQALLMVGQAEIAGPVSGTSDFAARFAARGPEDKRGRSLRDLDLEERLFRYPLSYLIYSEAFNALPEALRSSVYNRIEEVLSGIDSSPEFAHLGAADRAAIREILAETHAGFAAFLSARR